MATVYIDEPVKVQDRFEAECEKVDYLYNAQLVQAKALFASKNREYDNAIWRTGLLGAVIEIIGASARFKKMVLHNPTHGRDVRKKLRDVLLDILNYAAIALLMLEADNWEGN